MKVYTKNEIEDTSAKLLKELSTTHPELNPFELSAILLYGASYVLYMGIEDPSKDLAKSAAIAYNILTNPSNHATLPVSAENSAVQGNNREDSKDSSS